MVEGVARRPHLHARPQIERDAKQVQQRAHPSDDSNSDGGDKDSEQHGRHCVRANAQVQGRPLGVAEACAGGGVPCNAQLGQPK